jgi:hypothetical protein
MRVPAESRYSFAVVTRALAGLERPPVSLLRRRQCGFPRCLVKFIACIVLAFCVAASRAQRLSVALWAARG